MRDWIDTQQMSSTLLAQGIYRLCQSAKVPPTNVRDTDPGNYLVSNATTPLYIGEGGSLALRTKVQFDERRSTFYKNYLRSNPETALPISGFDLRIMKTFIGRKEIEDFGIVHLSTALNRFQLGKREPSAQATEHARWDELQEGATELVKLGAAICLEQQFQRWEDGTSQSTAGLYLIRNADDEIIYVGESSDIYSRFQTHGSTTYFSAVRRNLGCDILGYTLQTRNGKKRYFDDHEDRAVTAYLECCSIAFFPVSLGRYEVEEHLIRKLRPLLNRKSKDA